MMWKVRLWRELYWETITQVEVDNGIHLLRLVLPCEDEMGSLAATEPVVN